MYPTGPLHLLPSEPIAYQSARVMESVNYNATVPKLNKNIINNLE